jgi:hypothetical protein
MSKRHIQKSRECGGRRVLPEDEMLQDAQDVWKELANSKVASAYFLASRIADKVIQAKGDHKFIGSGGSIHCGIGNHFEFTENSIEVNERLSCSQ